MIEVSIRPERLEDREAIQHVNTQAFGRAAEAELVDRVRQSDGFLSELSLVAWSAGRIIGHALFSRVHLQTETDRLEILALGPLAVLPEFQRQGVGGRMIADGVERAARDGWRAIALIGHPEYYPRFGFVPASRFGLKSTFQVPDEVFMALPLREGGLDGLTGMVIFPTAFDGV